MDPQYIQVMPNPSALEIAVEVQGQKGLYQIWDTHGRILEQSSFYAPTFRISIAQFPNGLYNLKVKDDEGKLYLKKFIKQ